MGYPTVEHDEYGEEVRGVWEMFAKRGALQGANARVARRDRFHAR